MTRTFDMPIKTNDQSVDRVLAAGLPLVLVFLNGSAPAELEQAMNSLAREHAGVLLLAQVQVKDNPKTTRRYQVGQAPALVTVRHGQVGTKADAISGADLEQHVAFLLGKGPRPRLTHPSTTARTSDGSGSTGAGSASSPAGRPLSVSDSDFEQEVMRSSLPVLVDFWAPWCGPCRMTEPILEKLAGEMAGRLRVVKVNVDENPLYAGRYGVRSIPTMMIVKGGSIVDKWTGALPEGMLRSRVSPYV